MFQLRTLNKILKQHKLELVKDFEYFYFIYDDVEENNIYEVESIMVPRLNDLTIHKWQEYAAAFLEKIKERHPDKVI